MTWAEFVRTVDAALVEQGVGRDIEVWYIDASYPDADALDIDTDDDEGLSINQ